MKQIAIIDCRSDDKTVYSMEKANFTVIPTLKLDYLYDDIASHTDIQVHYSKNGNFITSPDTYEYYKGIISDDFTILSGKNPLSNTYPNDIWYNVAAFGDNLICKSSHTDSTILNEYRTNRIINVKQGYSKCNICPISDNAMITSDVGICKAAARYNIDVLLIDKGNIRLRNLPYGFIGGATGLINKNTLAVNGDIYLHPNGKEIYDFCKKYSVDIFPLRDGMLEDIGSIITTL